MKPMKKIVALIALIAVLSGCGGDTSWAFKSGEDVIPAGLYIIGQINAYSEAAQTLADENENNAEFVQPSQKELLKMQIEGKPAPEWINERARDFSGEIIAINRKADSLGITLDEIDNTYVENAVTSVKSQNEDFHSKNGVSDDSLRRFYSASRKRTKLFTAIYGEGGELEVPEAEIKEYFKANYVKAEILPMQIPSYVPEGETKTLEELQSEAKEKAAEYLKRAEAGEDMAGLAYEVVSGLTNAEEAPEKTTSEDITVIVSENNKAQYGEEFIDALMKTKPGETGQFDAMGSTFIYKTLDVLDDAEGFEKYKESLLIEMKDEEFMDDVVEWGKEIALEENAVSISRYKPEKIKFPE